MLSGPYYRWKIFDDHFNAPFGALGDCRIITEQKLKKALICALGYWALSLKYTQDVGIPEAFDITCWENHLVVCSRSLDSIVLPVYIRNPKQS